MRARFPQVEWQERGRFSSGTRNRAGARLLCARQCIPVGDTTITAEADKWRGRSGSANRDVRMEASSFHRSASPAEGANRMDNRERPDDENDFELFEGHHKENFATALLAFACRSSPPFREELTKLLLERARKTVVGPIKSKTIDRDRRIDAEGKWRRPDLVIEAETASEQWVLLVEAKLGAAEQPDQLRAYRDWLNGESDKQHVLATLTRNHRNWSVPPDATLVWIDLIAPVTKLASLAESDFERRFWNKLKRFLEVTMPTFDGFSAHAEGDLSPLMVEANLFVDTLCDALDRASSVHPTSEEDWKVDRIARHFPDLDFSIGFWWWHENPRDPKHRRDALAIKFGRNSPVVIEKFSSIVARFRRASEEGTLAERFDELAGQFLEKIKAQDPPIKF